MYCEGTLAIASTVRISQAIRYSLAPCQQCLRLLEQNSLTRGGACGNLGRHQPCSYRRLRLTDADRQSLRAGSVDKRLRSRSSRMAVLCHPGDHPSRRAIRHACILAAESLMMSTSRQPIFNCLTNLF